ncbi:TATA box-binding protein-associated factor RNA polymerase I subunit B [Apostasia shenzhenica]|uniref:TATA box-binding protein-associated factor RNA polymerase I subunit B n=1 Tax=Apostasia shenzhenica TaxID=1088818 RepID=A0A2I0BEM2_9ASPA|nr:TATA box-binding protein-associated factor RNA polymerase I subunit B [Apostasia shenzhenica]
MESPLREEEEGDDQLPEERRKIFCEACGGNYFEGSDDGFFYCSQCGSQSQDVIATCADTEDVLGGVNSLFRHRAKGCAGTSAKSDLTVPSKEEILRSLGQPYSGAPPIKDSEKSPYEFEDSPSSPQDFGFQGCKDPGKAVEAIRLRYVQGLQVMLQLQCEALVQKFGVSPLICSTAMTTWLRYVAVSRVFDDSWVEKVIDEAKIAAAAGFKGKCKLEELQVVARENGNLERTNRSKSKRKVEHSDDYGQKAISVSFLSLRKTLPVYSTLATSFLACHIARESVLPTDIQEWVTEAKIPYLNGFIELEKYLGTPPKFFPLSSRLMFRPIRVVSAWLLEVTAATIAESCGIRTPSLNFYAIALRYLKELSLPVSKILQQACKLYEWSLPSELWLSNNKYGLPTRVYLMSILIVTIRILYNIHGQGVWESQYNSKKSMSDRSNPGDLGSLNLISKQKVGSNHFISSQDGNIMKPSPVTDFSSDRTPELSTVQLLQILEAAYHKTTTNEYSKDLLSYLKYCKDVIFPGLTPSFDEGKLIRRLWDLYDKQQDDDVGLETETEFPESKHKRPRDGESVNSSLTSKKKKEEKQENASIDACAVKRSSAAATSVAIENMKFDMEDNGFHYLEPKVYHRADCYLHYKRQNIDGKFIYVAHADYYILLRACAKLAQVDPRILHIGVLKFEKRLDWIEQRIDGSLKLLSKSS